MENEALTSKLVKEAEERAFRKNEEQIARLKQEAEERRNQQVNWGGPSIVFLPSNANNLRGNRFWANEKTSFWSVLRGISGAIVGYLIGGPPGAIALGAAFFE